MNPLLTAGAYAAIIAMALWVDDIHQQVEKQSKTIDTINQSLDTINRTLGYVNRTLSIHSQLREMGKMPDAPPLRWKRNGPYSTSLQYWTEKDGWQWIPSNYNE